MHPTASDQKLERFNIPILRGGTIFHSYDASPARQIQRDPLPSSGMTEQGAIPSLVPSWRWVDHNNAYRPDDIYACMLNTHVF